MNFIKDMISRGLQHISSIKYMILPEPLVSDTLHSHKIETMTG